MTDLVPRPGAGPGVRGGAAGAAGRRQPGGAAPPRRRRPVPAGPVGRRHRRRRPARCRGLGGAQDGHRGGRVPPLPRAARAGHVVLGHGQPLGRAPHLDRRASGAARIEAATTWVHIDIDVGSPEPDPGRASTRSTARPHGGRRVKARLDHPDPPDGDARRLRRGRSASPTSTSSATSTTPPAGRSSRRPWPADATSARRSAPRSSTAPPSSAARPSRCTVADDDGALSLWARADGDVATSAVVAPR